MGTHQEVRGLERAREVKAFLLQDNQISAERLFMVEPDSLSPKKKKSYKASRVVLNVR